MIQTDGDAAFLDQLAVEPHDPCPSFAAVQQDYSEQPALREGTDGQMRAIVERIKLKFAYPFLI